MVILLQKRWLIPCLIVCLSTVTLLSVLQYREHTAAMSQDSLSISTGPVFVLDAGHGGSDGGAVSLSGVTESEINLAVTLRARDIFALLGQETVLTRSDERSLADDPSASLRQQKVSDTQNRVALINGIENGRLISIHQNALAGHSTVRGAQVFYSKTDGSAEIAETIQQALNAVVNKGNEKNKKPISSDVYLMNHISCPAVLVECGFLSNETETKRLQDPTYQTLLAITIVTAAWQS